jgi:hypothetical protein
VVEAAAVAAEALEAAVAADIAKAVVVAAVEVKEVVVTVAVTTNKPSHHYREYGIGNNPDESGSMQLADGRKLYHVKLVGAVRSVEDFSTNVVYEVEDGTGLMEASSGWTKMTIRQSKKCETFAR